MHLELEELQKQIDGARKYAAADGAAAGRDGTGKEGMGGLLSPGRGEAARSKLIMHLMLTLFYSEKNKKRGRRASPSCVAAAASSPSSAGPLEPFMTTKKNHSMRVIVMLIFFRGYSSASFRATMPLLLSGAFKRCLLEEPAEEQLPVHVIMWFIEKKKKMWSGRSSVKNK